MMERFFLTLAVGVVVALFGIFLYFRRNRICPKCGNREIENDEDGPKCRACEFPTPAYKYYRRYLRTGSVPM